MSVTNEEGRYAGRGVSASKKEVHAVVDNMDAGLFPGAFCKITPDYLTGDPTKCNLIHSDGSGTKSTLAYIHWRETGDASAFKGISQDSIVMNVDDLLCVGAHQGILLSSTVNRNPHNFSGECLAALIQGTEEFLATLREMGVDINSGGGETADVPDLTGTATVDSCATAVMNRNEVITGAKIVPGLVIVGLASGGQAKYEDCENSGIGSNGLTSARHDLLSSYYKKYTETFSKETNEELIYCGPYKMEDPLPGSTLTVGEALRSPTRTYAPVISKLLKEHHSKVKGIVHCSGGGQTKCIRFGNKVHFIKDNLFPTPPIFKAIQEASQTTWQEMYKVYNMGHRMEIFCTPEDAETIMAVAEEFGIESRIVGKTVKSEQGGSNHMSLTHNGETLTYSL